MSTFITIRLVGEPEDRLFERIEMDPNIHVKDLMTEVEVTTKIPPRFQVLKFRGEPLPTLEHPLRTIKFGEEIIVLGSFVLLDGTSLFYVKTLGAILGPETEIDFPSRPKFDMIEVFVYYTLKEIGIGPSEVFVIPDSTKSELVFLSTKLIEGFVTASGVTANDMLNESKSANQGKVIITPEIRKEMRQEMKLLSSLLCLTDLLGNPDNHGVIEHIPTEEEKLDGKFSRYELRIVDFGINLRMIDDEPSIFNSSTDVQSLIMYSKKWKLSESVEKAKESMENDPVLKNNKNGNVKTYNRYIKRLDAALEKIESGN
uniref:Ubiquitin-like domain-containing protein n=1 Tax=Caenorhabditis tropicalis TaxID=1561998 RepID=A0A1I7V292_9PELO